MGSALFICRHDPVLTYGVFLFQETVMITFKSVADLSKLCRDDPAYAVIQNILTDFPRDPDIHGYVVLIEPGDTHIDLPELKGTIADMSWDGVTKQDGYYHAVYLTNNEFAIEVVIPGANWLDADLGNTLETTIKSVSYMINKPPF
jgi:hypothetical protein